MARCSDRSVAGTLTGASGTSTSTIVTPDLTFAGRDSPALNALVGGGDPGPRMDSPISALGAMRAKFRSRRDSLGKLLPAVFRRESSREKDQACSTDSDSDGGGIV